MFKSEKIYISSTHNSLSVIIVLLRQFIDFLRPQEISSSHHFYINNYLLDSSQSTANIASELV